MDQQERLFQMAMGQGKNVDPADAEAKKDLPYLWDGLTKRDLPNNYVREPWQITVKRGLCCFLVTIRDNTLKQTLTVSCDSLGMVWRALEDELKKPRPAWMPMTGKEPYPRKRRQQQ